MENRKVKIKKSVAIVAGIVAIAIIITVIFLVSVQGKNSEEKKLISRIEELGKRFYEDFYYPYTGKDDEERAQTVQAYETLGIKVDLSNLSRYNTEDSQEVLKEFVNKKTNEACDKTNTKAIIYPTSPYGKKDYKIKVELDCGFDKKNEETK